MMSKPLRTAVLAASATILLLFVLFVINQTAQVVSLASTISPFLGSVVLWLLLALYGLILLIPLVLFLRLPKPLRPPVSEEGDEARSFLEALKKRLAANPNLGGRELRDRAQIQEAIALLDSRADELVRNTAATVFISTAISQSGRLDAFLVLGAQSRMVWQIARLYYQRPSPREFLSLYANVAATAFLAGEMDDMDIHDQVQPIVSSTLGALAVSVPGVQLAASLIVNSVLTGTANAFLTLRVGMIARRYCGALAVPERRSLRRAATLDAARLLGAVVRQGTAKVSKAVWDASKGKVDSTVSGVKEYARQAGRSILSKLGIKDGEEPGKLP